MEMVHMCLMLLSTNSDEGLSGPKKLYAKTKKLLAIGNSYNIQGNKRYL